MRVGPTWSRPGGPRVKERILGIALACSAACAGSTGDREVRLERLSSENRALLAQLEDLQARLIVDQERVRFWEEMRDRHASVSAIACASQDAHSTGMARSFEQQGEGDRPDLRPRPARVAALRAGPTIAGRQ